MLSWRHLNFFQHQAYLNARTPRIRCEACGIKTVAAVARIVGEHDTRLWRVLHHYVEQARAHPQS